MYVDSTSTFNMSGEDALIENNAIIGRRPNSGAITPDTKTAGGGVCIASGGTFTMDNGTIQGNSAQTGAGVCIMGTFNFNDGTITSNKKGSGGTDVDFSVSNINSLETTRNNRCNSYNFGANVEIGLPGTFNMNGGTITSTLIDTHGNYVPGQNGAGVCIYGASADGDTGGTATFNMTGGSITGLKIGQNAAVSINIQVTDARGVFNMSGGSITNNIYESTGTSSSTDSHGGALCIQNRGDFIMTGGEISGNHARDNGGAVYMYDSSSTITLGKSGDTSTIIIKDNTAGTSNAVDNIYLQSGRTIAIAGALDTESEVGIKRSGGFVTSPFTSGYASTNGGTAPDQIFTSDEGYRIIAGTGGEAAFGASSGGLYLPGDYNFTFTASRNKVVVGHDADVTITPTVKRTEAGGTEIDLFYNPVDHKLYVDSLYTLPAGGDNEVTWEASLWCGSEVEQASLAAVDTDSNANKFTIAALDYPDTYTLRVCATYMGYTHDASFTIQSSEFFGSKAPGETLAVGDIVFNDGSSTPYTDGMIFGDDEKEHAIAIIFYKSTSAGDELGVKTLGVGIQHSATGLKWCIYGANANSRVIDSIICTPSGSPGAYTFSGDIDGSDNLSQIGSFLGSQSDIGSSSKYPAFYYCKNYKNETGSNVSGTSYENDWYLPSIAEIYQIYKNGKGTSRIFDIDGALQALNGAQIGTTGYWSSTQDGSSSKAYGFRFSTKECFPALKDGSWTVRCIRAF